MATSDRNGGRVCVGSFVRRACACSSFRWTGRVDERRHLMRNKVDDPRESVRGRRASDKTVAVSPTVRNRDVSSAPAAASPAVVYVIFFFFLRYQRVKCQQRVITAAAFPTRLDGPNSVRFPADARYVNRFFYPVAFLFYDGWCGPKRDGIGAAVLVFVYSVSLPHRLRPFYFFLLNLCVALILNCSIEQT